MKRYILTTGLTLGFAYYLFSISSHSSSARAPSVDSEQRTVVASTSPAIETPKLQSIPQRIRPATREAFGEGAPAFEKEEDFREVVKAIDITYPDAITAAILRLRASDSDIVADFFIKGLQKPDEEFRASRAQLTFLAHHYDGPALQPFWTDLALRTTPAFDNENELVAEVEPSSSRDMILQEMVKSFEHLGSLGLTDESARDTLSHIVLKPKGPVHSTFMRRQAYVNLRNANTQAAIRTLSALSADDPLQASLIPSK
ncbi:MAG: hypothetical protein EOP10_10855 [Proteobacteria bacterium]|nr:MAG: hypothetical protein EOP10_10855 [Pseudomonadota bacterium]